MKSGIELSERPQRAAQQKLESLHQQVLRMGHLPDEVFAKALRRVSSRDATRVAKVAVDDLPIDDLDNEIGTAKNEVLQAHLRSICGEPEASEQGVYHLLIGKNLERVGDHASNIAEDVVLVVESLNLKHAEKLAQ